MKLNIDKILFAVGLIAVSAVFLVDSATLAKGEGNKHYCQFTMYYLSQNIRTFFNVGNRKLPYKKDANILTDLICIRIGETLSYKNIAAVSRTKRGYGGPPPSPQARMNLDQYPAPPNVTEAERQSADVEGKKVLGGSLAPNATAAADRVRVSNYLPWRK